MIIKAAQNPNAGALHRHLTRLDHNERVEVAHLRGVLAADLRGAMAEMEALAAGTQCRKHFYHISVAIQDGEKLERGQWLGVADRVGQEFGIQDHARAVVFHIKEGKEHMHIVFSRIDPETMKAAQLSHDYRRNARLARELEQELGLNPVRSRRVDEREQQRTAHDWEDEAGRRLLTNPREHRDALADCYRTSDTGQAFVSAIAECGFDLHAGDRRGYLAVERETGVFYSIDKRLTGHSASQVREKFSDLPPLSPLPPPKERENRPSKANNKAPATEKDNADKERQQARRKEWREFYKAQAKQVFELERLQAKNLEEQIKSLDQQILQDRLADPRANWFKRVGYKLIGRDLDAERDVRDQQRITARLGKIEFLKSQQLVEQEKLVADQKLAREECLKQLHRQEIERCREADKAAGIVRARFSAGQDNEENKGRGR